MTRQEIEKTAWARRFKHECPTCYEQAIKIAMANPEVEIDEELGELYIVTDDDFVLEIYKNEAACIELCKKMGWRIIE